AEYFQPKYDEIINAIKAYKGGWGTLESLVTLKNSNFTPSDIKTYQYIALANIAGNGEITDCMTDEGQNLPTRARRKVNTGDVVVSSIEGSLSSIAIIGEEYNDALCSTGFHVINSNHLNSGTLLVLLKSFVGQLQLKKGCSGTILTAINQNAFSRILLPILPQAQQLQIQQKITESFELRKQSKQLLENAKRAVEIAIEQDESKAIQWLDAQLV
ncbi:type I restriction endonuclease subunit S, partial [Methylococcaceae bacterium CS2]